MCEILINLLAILLVFICKNKRNFTELYIILNLKSFLSRIIDIIHITLLFIVYIKYKYTLIRFMQNIDQSPYYFNTEYIYIYILKFVA